MHESLMAKRAMYAFTHVYMYVNACVCTCICVACVHVYACALCEPLMLTPESRLATRHCRGCVRAAETDGDSLDFWHGKRVLLAGASSGLGEAIALERLMHIRREVTEQHVRA